MELAKLNKCLKQFYELQVDPTFQDFLQRGSDEVRRRRKKYDVDPAEKDLNNNPDNDHFRQEYEKALRNYKSSTDYDRVYKRIYDISHIDLQQATIKKVPLPKNEKEIKALLQDGKPTILSSRDKLFLYDNNATLHTHMEPGYNDHYINPHGEHDNYGRLSALDSAVEINGFTVKMDTIENIADAFKVGLIDNVWKVDGPSTNELRDKRKDSKRGSLNRDPGNKYADKSGYKRGPRLSHRLADTFRSRYVNELKDIKDKMDKLSNQLSQKLITDAHRITPAGVNRIKQALHNAESIYVGHPFIQAGDVKDATDYIDEANLYLAELKYLVNQLKR